jgi:CMP-N-acetylneuraminic acid synthetase
MRSGSQRVKNKNLRHLVDKPLFEFILDELSRIPEFDYVVVDSNSDEILESAGALGIQNLILSKRPEELASSTTSMVEVLKLVSEKFPADWYFQTHATSPFLTKSTISNALNQVVSDETFDSGFGVSEIQQRLWSVRGEPINHDPNVLMPTQDLEPIRIENSSFYIFRKSQLFELGTRYGKKPKLIVIPKLESIDIDDEEDFELASMIRQGQLWGEKGE